MQAAGAGAADSREKKKKREKAEINSLDRRVSCESRQPSISDFPIVSNINTLPSGCTHIRKSLRDKGKGSSGRNDLRNFARAAKIPLCGPMIDLIQCATHRERRKPGGGARFQLGPPREDKELPGVVGAAFQKLTIGDRRSPSETAGYAHASLA